jgi:hypothetical protein
MSAFILLVGVTPYISGEQEREGGEQNHALEYGDVFYL